MLSTLRLTFPARAQSISTRSHRPALPGLTVRLDVVTRRWFCRNRTCPRQVFVERLPELAAPRARRTTHLAAVLEAVALALANTAGGHVLTVLILARSPADNSRTDQQVDPRAYDEESHGAVGEVPG